MIATPSVTHAGWLSNLFGKKQTTVKQENNNSINSNVSNNATTNIGATTNQIQGDTNTVNIPKDQTFYDGNFSTNFAPFFARQNELNQAETKKLIDNQKENNKALIDKAERITEQATAQSKENTTEISTAIKEPLKLHSDTQSLLSTLNQGLITPLQGIVDKLQTVVDTSLTNNTALISAINTMPFPTPGGTTQTFTQTTHGFVVGDWVYLVGTVYTKTDSDAAASADSVGVVTSIPTVNTFTLATEGYVTGLSGLTAGTRYYLGATAGAITATAPSSNIKAVFIADSATSGYVQQYAVGQSSLPGTIAQVFASSAVTPSASQINAGTSVLIPGMTATLTPSGTTKYLVLTSVRARSQTTAQNNSVDGGIQAALFDSTAPTVALTNSEINPMYNNNGNTISLNTVTQNIQATSGGSYILTISSPITLQVRAWNIAAATTGTVMADNAGRTSMTIIQLNNNLPVSGLVEYGDTVNLVNQVFSTTSFVASTNGSYILPEAGTYDLRYDVATDGTGLNTTSQVAIFDDTGTVIAETERTRGGSVTTAQVLTAQTRVTTTGAATYTLRGRNGGGGAGSMTILNVASNKSTISWRKAGASAVYAGVYPGTWTSYTPVITSTGGTNPTLPTSATITGNYSIQGKTMFLNIRYNAPSITNGVDGTGSYQWSIPAGYTIDTTKASIPSVLTNTSGSGLDGGVVGSGFGRNSTGGNSGGLIVMPLSTTTIGAWFEPATRLMGASALAMTGASNTTYSFVCQIPIN